MRQIVHISITLIFLLTIPTAGWTGDKPTIRFKEIGKQAGVRFIPTSRQFLGHKAQVLEMFTDGGCAVAVGDFNNDGYDDMFVTDSDAGKRNRLMRNNGDMTFTDIAVESGVSGGNDSSNIVADALWFDYNNDGFKDLLVARFGTPILYRNEGPEAGKGHYSFTDVSNEKGLTKFGNTVAAIAFDADRDGYLDLLLGNYFPSRDLLNLDTPHVLPNNLDYADNGGGVTFWRNLPGKNGGRIFVEATTEMGFAHHTGWSLDLGHADINNDGWQDVYIAGDYGTDRLFFNKGDGTGAFEDVTEAAIGFDTRKGMNVDMGDYNRDGWLDIYVTNITDDYMRECNMLWHNNGDGTLIDLSRETGVCDTDWGWAGKFGDFDNDGWEDLFVVNGLRSAGEHDYIPLMLEMIITPGIDFSDINNYPDIGDRTWSGYQKQRLFQNQTDGTFKETGAEAGVDNDFDGRGIGMADFNNDGLIDLYQTNARQPALLYKGVTENAGNWVEMKLIGTQSNRDAIGARVVLTATDGEVYLREINCGNAYASQSTTRLHFGIGSATGITSVEILWPNGTTETIDATDNVSVVPVNAVTWLKEGARQ